MKKIISYILMIIIILSLSTYKVSANNNPVSVTIPSFQVTINDEIVQSTELKYPLIVYDDITYFPLTWEWCSELGLASAYTNEEGLYIANYISQIEEEILHKKGYQAAGSKHRAVIPSYPVFINGRKIDNNIEEYPLLNFRNITYFPLTWTYVVDEFGWDQSWSDSSGFKISTYDKLKEYPPGSYYDSTSFNLVENYNNYSLIEKSIEERSISPKANEYGDYSNNYEDRRYEYYKLDYDSKSLSKTTSKEREDTPYNSGAIQGEDASESFTSKDSILFFKESNLIDLSEDAGIGNSIDKIYAKKHNVNDMKIYLASVTFTQGNTSIPAPYTPTKYYVFIQNANNKLQHLDLWPTDQIPSDVYPCGNNGVYLSSKARIFGSGRYSNGRSMVFLVKSDLSVKNLNERWDDWNSLNAIGTDDYGNLYLLNSWFPNFQSIDGGQGTISTIRDGYFQLNLKGEIKKIYPFIDGQSGFVTPSGQVYVHANWIDSIFHLQSASKIMLD